jgi:hypothetical protein
VFVADSTNLQPAGDREAPARCGVSTTSFSLRGLRRQIRERLPSEPQRETLAAEVEHCAGVTDLLEDQPGHRLGPFAKNLAIHDQRR